MSKLIQKAGFLNPKRAGRYMNYIATRDGVEPLDENADSIYMHYIATRPRVEKHGEHGLFGAEDAVDLEKTLGELKAHEGNVWTIIYSLRREDAARLGYDNAASWRALLRSKQADFAEAMQIPPSQLRWYAAFHDEDEHPHIHMMLWSDDPKYGFLRKDKLLHLQSVLTNMIYADELKAVYVQKDIAYKDVTGAARETMRRIVDQLETVENPPESIRQKLMELALDGYKVNAYRYILKRDVAKQLPSCLEDIYASMMQAGTKTLTVHHNRETVRIPLDQIYYLESEGRVINVYGDIAREHFCTFYGKLKELPPILARNGFLQVGRSDVVNLQHVCAIRNYRVLMKNGVELSVSRSKYAAVRAAYLEWKGQFGDE